MNHTLSSLRLAATFIAGALAGAVAGVLFAPSKGRKTRKKLLRQAESIKNDLVHKLNVEANILHDNIMYDKMNNPKAPANDSTEAQHQVK